MLMSMSISEFAEQEKRTGKIYIRDGIWWTEVRSFFCRPLHLLQEVPIGKRPPMSRAIVGYQHIVSGDKDTNSFITVMEIDKIQEYSLKSLDSKKRNQVRRGLERVEVKEITDIEDLFKDGFEVCRSFFHRTKWGQKRKYINYNHFYKWIESIFVLPNHLTLGAYFDGKLVAFLRGHAIKDVAYLSFIASHSDFLHLYPNDALIYTFIMRFKEVEGVKRVVYGIESLKKSLDKFKESLGFKPKRYFAYYRLNPFAEFYLKNFMKKQYRRLLGKLRDQGC